MKPPRARSEVDNNTRVSECGNGLRLLLPRVPLESGLIDAATEKLAEFVARPLGYIDLCAMFIDGIELAERSVLIALGVSIDGTKVPLGIWAGSTENHRTATALLFRAR